ncbi:hypothetical protein X777_13791 [Ooceraea biroi]|nr:hypothetical protein X777_13791 [Ooceraea biroi]
MATTPATLQHNLHQFLRQYRKAPHATTGQSPAQLFLGRSIRTNLDLVRPEETNVRVTQKLQQASINTMFREFQPKQLVYFLSGNPRMDKWLPGIVVTRLGDLHYEIDYSGKKIKRHADQIRNRPVREKRMQRTNWPTHDESFKQPRRIHFYGKEHNLRDKTPPSTPRYESESDSYVTGSSGSLTPTNSPRERRSSPPLSLRRSSRISRPPQRFVPG